MKFSSLKTDPNKETRGVWMNYGGGLKVLIARSNNAKFRDMVNRLTRPHQVALKTGMVEPKVAEEIMRTSAAQHILLGWENLEDDDGNAIPYSPEKAKQLFDEAPDFFSTVMELANSAALFKVDDLGNS
jgi:hypothetical protein